MKAKLLLILAIVMGLVTTFLFFNYMHQYDTTAVINEQTNSVLVAKQNIYQNQLISDEMVELKKLPAKGIHPEAVTDASVVVGKYATSNFVAGEQILSSKVQTAAEESVYVSRKIKEGYRGVSVGANIVQTVSNLIEPEDYVDVLFSEPDPNTKTIKTEMILENVRVLAVGKVMTQPKPVEGEQAQPQEYAEVTLELTPEQTVKVVNADERGNIHLTLHTRVQPSKGGGKDGK